MVQAEKSGFFVDWLQISQKYDSGEVVGKARSYRVDLETGEVGSGRVYGREHEGSFSSVVHVVADGSVVRVSGNPSRFDRLDNLFGVDSIKAAVDVFNGVLFELGLPLFKENDSVEYLTGKDGRKVTRVGNGALIERIDLTRNWAVGHGNEKAFIRALSTQRIGERGAEPYLYLNGLTVDWFKGSRRKYVKVYAKGAELRMHRKKSRSDEEKIYLDRLIRYCEGKGIVREEHSFKARELKRLGYELYGEVEVSEMLASVRSVEDAINRLDVEPQKIDDVAERLIGEGVCKTRHSANSTAAVYHRWLMGLDIAKNSQFYVHKKRLLSLGVDISVPLDVSRSLPTIRTGKVINAELANPPGWYHMPGRPILRVVK